MSDAAQETVSATPRRKIRLMVAVPTHEHMPSTAAYDMLTLVGYMAANFIGDSPGHPIEAINVSFVTGTYIHTARQRLAEIAAQNGSDYILWLDSDMKFPRDIVLKLLRHKKDVVGINYSSRGVPPHFVAIKSVYPPEKCITTPESTGIEKVEAIGFGAVLMKADVLRALPDPKAEDGPWFQFEWQSGLQKELGEDVYFCRLLAEHGVEVYVDHDVSKECAHVGTMQYKVEHAYDMWVTEQDARAEAGEED